MLDIISGLLKQDSGFVDHSAVIGYVMQRGGFQESLSCLDNLRLEAALCGLKGAEADNRITRLIADCEMSEFISKRVSTCSAGMRARLSLALALMPNPSLLLLDEAFSALDMHIKDYIKQMLIRRKKEGMAIVMVSHLESDFKGLCERVLRLPAEEVSAV